MDTTKWRQRITHSKHGIGLIGVLSFLESTILPFVIELVMIPYMILRRERLWLIATAVFVGCFLGACVGYALGYFAMDSAGRWIVDAMGWETQSTALKERFDENGFFAILLVGVAPVPFQLAMLAAGAVQYSFPLYLVATALSRGVRYFGLALLVHLFGDKAERIWQRHRLRASIAATVLIVVIWLMTAALS